MSKTALQWLGASLVITTLSTGCVEEAPLSPDPSTALAGAGSSTRHRAVDLGACENLQVSAGSRLASRVFAQGVQIYHWNGTSWAFDGPLAVLSADAEGKSTVGIHYSGPTWESVSGGKVVGTVLERCTPDPNAIPWLLLAAVSTEGPGIFHRVTFIQRINTVGGIAPSEPGSFIGEEARVQYTTEYLFFR